MKTMNSLLMVVVCVLMASSNVFAAGAAIGGIGKVKVPPIYVPPAKKYSISGTFIINRVYHNGDTVEVARNSGMARGNQGLSYSADGTTVSTNYSIDLQVEDSGMLGDLDISVYSTKENFLGRSCPQTMPFALMRSKLETVWSAQAVLDENINYACVYSASMPAEEFREVYDYLHEHAQAYYFRLGFNGWADTDVLGVTLNPLDLSEEHQNVLDDYRDTLSGIIQNNAPLIEDLMWDHGAAIDVEFGMNRSYRIP